MIDETLATWHSTLESPNIPVRQTRMVYAVNRSTESVLKKLSRAQRMGEFGLHFSRGWDESIDRKKGYFESGWGRPASWGDAILQGPHLFVATPMYKMPNRTMLHQQDWSATDFESLTIDAIPITAYKPTRDRRRYDCDYTLWGDEDPRSARDFYRVAWRAMAANTNERTLISAIIPPGAAHVNGIFCVGSSDISPHSLVEVAGFSGSLVGDFLVRIAPKNGIFQGSFNRLPIVSGHSMRNELTLRVLRLNCVTSAYADLWRDCYSPSFLDDTWTGGLNHVCRLPISLVGPVWTSATPLRISADRRQALVEVDALVSLMLGLTAAELCAIYRTQFPVLYGYDRNVYCYDINGRLVPNSVLSVWRKKGDRITQEERTATNQAGNTYTYELPFVTLDREADMRQAYAHFERLLKERS